MRRMAIFSFTDQGRETAARLMEGLKPQGYRFFFRDGRGGAKGSLKEQTEQAFREMDGLIFVGAAGIAVRLIAPFVTEKTSDPAVVVVDEQGKFAISLLSGHIGGANRLAREAAEVLSATPVITTATDLRGAFAVDVFAAENGLAIGDMKLARAVSAAVLRGERIGFFSDFPVEGAVPAQLEPEGVCRCNLYITQKAEGLPPGFEKKAEGEILRLFPRTAVLGMGCRRGASRTVVQAAARAALKQADIGWQALGALATIERKKEEDAFLWLAKEWDLSFLTFTAGQLQAVPGKFSESAFVERTVGVANVCERAAMAGALCLRQEAESEKRWSASSCLRQETADAADAALAVRLLAGKTAIYGATAAVAVAKNPKNRRLRWRQENYT